jgi:vitamin B12 transporter
MKIKSLMNKKRYYFAVVYLGLLWSILFPLVVSAQQDSVKRQYLESVNVTANKIEKQVNSTTPLQILTQEQLKALPTLNVSDVLKFFSGIMVKDYGGVGGLKTVSVRGLGAQHTAVALNGIALTDCQTGQIDLGKISLENVETIALNSGQPDDIFLPARLFASANVLNVSTRKPIFKSKKPVNICAGVTAGSFGLAIPYLLIENQLKKKSTPSDWSLASSLSVEYLTSKGDYPYILQYGGAEDSTSNERRENSDVRTIKAEADLFAAFGEKQELDFKFFYYYAERGLPGATIFYGSVPTQRLWDENSFGQMHYKYRINPKFSYQANAKFNYSYTRYLDPDYLNQSGELDNRYIQREYYISNSLLYNVIKKLSFSLSNDVFFNDMDANLFQFSEPQRFTCLTMLAGQFNSDYVKIAATLLHIFAQNWVSIGQPGANANKLTPSVSISVKPFKYELFRIRAFYKNIFRMPTFNDLYYQAVGNVDLKPETANQIDAGVTYEKYWQQHKLHLTATADFYFNRVSNKIVAIPTKNLFIWSMLNYGQVDILGTDVNLDLSYRFLKKYEIRMFGTYSFQRSRDMTDETSKTYKNQIPYTPLHSGSAGLVVTTPWISVFYTILISGERYTLGQNIPQNRLESYTDQSIAVGNDFKLKKISFGIKLEMLNLANAQYEIVKNFPMQGRSFRIKLNFLW